MVLRNIAEVPRVSRVYLEKVRRMISTAIDTQKTDQAAPIFRGHIPELDALRAFGIIMVILEHMWPFPRHSSKVLDLSWTLMDSFFVLSGFLIAGILLDMRSRPDYYRVFYSRRALRILPLYYVIITILTVGSIVHGSGYFYAGIPELYKWGSLWWFFAYLGNIPPAITSKGPTAVRGAFSPLWSLQIEEQFYLLFPFLVRHLKLKTLAVVLLSLVCFSPILRIVLYWIYPSNTLIQYVLLPCRFDGLALGALIAVRFRMGPWNLPKRRLTVIAFALVAVTLICGAWSGYSLSSPFNRTIGYLISSIAWSSVILWLIMFRGSRITTCLRLAPVRHLANISYGAYLFHTPIARALDPISVAIGIRALSTGRTRVVAVLTLTLLLASLSFWFFERPMLRLKDRLFPSQRSPADPAGSQREPALGQLSAPSLKGAQ
jgi:peptidoglycan/LPS O-acetylase OafA/YrhL